MAQPGWYPDPAGVPGQFRHWDGTSWSDDTTADPTHAPAPHHPATDGVPGTGGRSPRRGGRLLPIVLAVVAVLLVAALLWWLLGRGGTPGGSAPEDTRTAAPSVSAWNERSSSPSASPSDPQPSGATLTDCPTTSGTARQHPADGRLHGGHISVASIPGWQLDMSGGPRWVGDVQQQVLPITGTWVSTSMVGELSRADGFGDPQTAARAFMSCFASSSFYQGITGRSDVRSQAVTIGGHQGWWLRSEVRVNYAADPQIPGDVVDLVVLDTGDPAWLSVWEGNATIGDAATQALVDQTRASIQVDQ